jgi:hypothetical protein
MSGIGQAVGGITNGIIGSQAAVTAGNERTAGYDSAENNASNVYNTNSANYQPYIQAGNKASAELSADTGQNGSLGRAFTTSDFHNSPGYQFDMQQGLSAINNSNSVRGGALSGGTQKSLSNYAEQQANNGYQQAYTNFTNNQNQNYNQLSGIANRGDTATQGLGALGSQYSSTLGNYLVGNGNSKGQEAQDKAAAIEGGVTDTMNGLSGQSTGYSGSGLSSLMGMFSS